MAPLLLEIYNANKKNWIKVGEVKPGDPPGCLSDNKPDGRYIYVFECFPDDSESVIYRSKFGVDIEIGQMRAFATLSLEVVKELQKGEKPL
jgi:hypothetical protein